MRKILLIGRRDYIATIRTRAFIVSLLAVPLLCGGAFLPIVLLQKHPDTKAKSIAVVDRTGLAAGPVIEALGEQNARDLLDKATGEQQMPRYSFEKVSTDGADPAELRLKLSDRVRRRELFGFVEIGEKAPEPVPGGARDLPANAINWYATEGDSFGAQQWVGEAVNDGLRRVRLSRLGVDSSVAGKMLAPATVEKMVLVSRDEKTGRIGPPRKKQELEFMVPQIVVMLLLLIVMMTSAPMLTAISEDKMQRVFEMLLVSATPFELIAGKVLAAVARSLTSAVVYITAALFLLYGLAMIGLAPVKVMPWFVVYLIAEVTILAALAAALGAACSTPQDANSFSWFLVLPVIVPFFMMFPILNQPNGTLAVSMSMFPLFTPIAMLVRQLSPGGIPPWQPWVALAGVAITTVAFSWVATRIFRVGILLQGKPPKLSDLTRWALRG